jgi:hypothetical protein
MKKLAILLSALLLSGCLATENRRVAITHKNPDGTVSPVDTSVFWWRTPYYKDSKNHPMDKFIPLEDLPDRLHGVDPLDADLLFFSRNPIRWPKTLRAPFSPPPLWTTPAPKAKKPRGVSYEQLRRLMKKLNKPLVPQRSEVY